MEKILTVDKLTKHYESFVAVDNVSFEIERGEILAIIGPNGAGKTTLISMISNHLLPSSGKCIINGLTDNEIRKSKVKNVGVVFGGELGFYNNATARENMHFFARLAKVPRKQVSEEVDRCLKTVKLFEVKDKNVGQFSRGMIQRLHIARALIGNPPLILLDEPTTGLDVELVYEMHDMIRELKSNGISFILTSHSMSEIEKLANRIILIGAGKIYFEGTAKDLFEYVFEKAGTKVEDLEEAYLILAPNLKREKSC